MLHDTHPSADAEWENARAGTVEKSQEGGAGVRKKKRRKEKLIKKV